MVKCPDCGKEMRSEQNLRFHTPYCKKESNQSDKKPVKKESNQSDKKPVKKESNQSDKKPVNKGHVHQWERLTSKNADHREVIQDGYTKVCKICDEIE